MNFNELGQTLPNGFHDAELRHFEMDYVDRILKFDLVVWTGRMEDPQTRELYRPARVNVTGVRFLVIEPPDTKYFSQEAGTIRIDTGEGVPTESLGKMPEAPEGTSITWMYLEEMNRFLIFGGAQASLEWTGPEENWRS